MAAIDVSYHASPYYESPFGTCVCVDTSGESGSPGFLGAVVTQSIADSELGVDIACLTDIDPNLTLVGGWENFANAECRRLLTVAGFLFDVTGDTEAADYGEDIRAKLNAGFTEADVGIFEGRIQAQMMADERAKSADVDVAFNFATSTLTATIDIETAEGTFTLIMKVDQLTVEILDGSGNVLVSG